MTPGGADLFFDEMKIVEQPFRRRRDRAFASIRLGHELIGVQEDAFVLVQASDEFVGRRPGCQFVGRRHRFGVPFELFDIEEFRAQRLFFFVPRRVVGLR